MSFIHAYLDTPHYQRKQLDRWIADMAKRYPVSDGIQALRDLTENNSEIEAQNREAAASYVNGGENVD